MPTPSSRELRILLACAAPYRTVLLAGMGLMLAESGVALLVPALGGQLAQAIVPAAGSPLPAIRTILAAMLALFAAQALLRFASAYVGGGVSQRIVADLRVRVYDHLQALPLAYFQQRRQGDALSLLAHDVYAISGLVGGTAPALVPLLVTAGGAALLMLRIEPMLGLAVLVLVPLFFLLLKVVGRRLRAITNALSAEQAAALSLAEENLGMLPAIKTFTREARESGRYRAQMDRIVRLSAAQLRILAALAPAFQFVAAAGIVLVLWFASDGIAGGSMTPSELVSFLLYATLLARPVSGLADVYGQVQGARGALARLARALDEPPEPPPHVGVPLPRVAGAIEFRGVGFAYPGRPPALVDVDLVVPARQTLALVGPNGAGKSTLAHLLARLHAPTAGSILVDGVDIATVSLPSLRAQIGVVPQHVLLFNASVRDNIAYGRPEPTPGEIEAAARAARAHDFIVALPQGYDTVIGDRGVRLSGGQQQRIALARALLKDPPILILDEATAMFDPEGEAEFLEGCRDALKARTVLLITHRPASLAVADRVVRMRAGRVEGG